MTILQAVQQVDALRPNTYSTRQKILWLSRLEAAVMRLLSETRGEAQPFAGFTEHTDGATVLFLAAPYDVAYLYWLEAQIHYANEETGLYNNAMAMFNTAFRAWKDDYHRNRAAGTTGRFRF